MLDLIRAFRQRVLQRLEFGTVDGFDAIVERMRLRRRSVSRQAWLLAFEDVMLTAGVYRHT